MASSLGGSRAGQAFNPQKPSGCGPILDEARKHYVRDLVEGRMYISLPAFSQPERKAEYQSRPR